MAKKPKSKKPLSSMPLDEAFSVLLREGRKAQRQKSNGKSMSEARRARINKTKNRLLTMEVLDAANEKILDGSMRKHHLLAKVKTVKCTLCGDENDHVHEIEVWSKGQSDALREPVFRLTGRVHGKMLWEFHQHLPITVQKTTDFNICARCLLAAAEERAHDHS